MSVVVEIPFNTARSCLVTDFGWRNFRMSEKGWSYRLLDGRGVCLVGVEGGEELYRSRLLDSRCYDWEFDWLEHFSSGGRLLVVLGEGSGVSPVGYLSMYEGEVVGEGFGGGGEGVVGVVGTCVVERFGVDPLWRRLGVGRYMFDSLQRLSGGTEISWLVTMCTERDLARQLFLRALGFECRQSLSGALEPSEEGSGLSSQGLLFFSYGRDSGSGTGEGVGE
jgi:ribosomal protein S18 acetylase RimI-like enzyme